MDDAPIAHGFEHESIEAKADWFQTLTIEVRLGQLAAFYRLAVALNPKLREGSDARPAHASVCVVEYPKG